MFRTGALACKVFKRLHCGLNHWCCRFTEYVPAFMQQIKSAFESCTNARRTPQWLPSASPFRSLFMFLTGQGAKRNRGGGGSRSESPALGTSSSLPSSKRSKPSAASTSGSGTRQKGRGAGTKNCREQRARKVWRVMFRVRVGCGGVSLPFIDHSAG